MTKNLPRPLNRRAFMRLAVLAGTAMSAGVGAPVWATANDPQSYVNAIAGEVMDLANAGQKGPELKAKFAAVLNRYINLKAIANYALGPYVKKLPSTRKDEFYDLVNN